MKVLDPGHRYELQHLNGPGVTVFEHYKDPDLHNGEGWSGPSSQEVIRMEIERVQTLDKEKPWKGNQKIIHHLRMALIGFEVRALERLVEKDEAVELIPVNERGHIYNA